MAHLNDPCPVVGRSVLTAAWLFVASVSAWGAAPLGTMFTYQGELTQDGSRVNDTCDCQFSLWDDPSAGPQVGPTLTFDGLNGNLSPIAVADGLLAVQLDFGPDAFNGEARWLEVAVACPSGETLQPLTPRQPLTATPYALALPGLYTQQNATSPNVIGGGDVSVVTPGVVGAVIGGGGAIGLHNRVTDDSGTVSGGRGNQAGDAAGSTGDRGWSTVGGGRSNTASGSTSTIGGGVSNTASGVQSTVAGGWVNAASALRSTIGGGFSNTADGSRATVGGGEFNTASGDFATVPGGNSNSAAGQYSFAAGRRAEADHDGAFVWADSTDADFTSTGPDQFLIRASGGVGINRNQPTPGALDVGGDGLFSGHIGIGTSNPQAPLHVAEGATGAGVILPGLRVEQNETSPNVIGGMSGNDVTSGVIGATIGGGGQGAAGFHNRVTDNYGTVGGGIDNQAGDAAGTTSDRRNATVSGGSGNTASGSDSTVAGGGGNTASGDYSTVIGGLRNTASGFISTVGGGLDSVAAGSLSFAAGRRAQAKHNGSFVWADSTDADFASTGTNQFLVRAGGGVGINTPSPAKTLDINEPLGEPEVAIGLRVGGSWKAEIAQTPSSILMVRNGGQDRVAIDAGGDVGIGTTNPTQRLHVAGNICATGSIGACSDARFKTNVEPLGGALAKIEKLRPVSFDWKHDEYPDHRFSDERQTGLIAQEVRGVYPEVVTEGSDGYLSIDYGRLTPLLIEAVKELKRTLEEKEADIAALRRHQDAEIKVLRTNCETLSARLERIEKMLDSDIP